jgi:hypothetical protein
MARKPSDPIAALKAAIAATSDPAQRAGLEVALASLQTHRPKAARKPAARKARVVNTADIGEAKAKNLVVRARRIFIAGVTIPAQSAGIVTPAPENSALTDY